MRWGDNNLLWLHEVGAIKWRSFELVQKLNELRSLAPWVTEPVRRPDAPDTVFPALAFQNFLPDSVTVPNGYARVIGGTITLNGGKIGRKVVGMFYRHIDSISGNPKLRLNLETVVTKHIGNRYLEIALGFAPSG